MKKAFVNGKIFTSNKKAPDAECFIVNNGFIEWVGNSQDMPEFDGAVIDLEGKRVLPGFIDSHMHAISLATFHNDISCLPPTMNSIEELISIFSEEAKKKKAGEWIIGRGYDEAKFAENRSPNRYDLDKACKDNPVFLVRNCGHIAVVNSKALEMAGITKDTPDPAGGKIGRNESGEPDGILYETGKQAVTEIMPPQSNEKDLNNLLKLSDILLAHGIVAVTDMGFRLADAEHNKIYETAVKKGFKQEVGIFYSWAKNKLEKADIDWAENGKNSDGMIRNCGVKLVADGSVGGRTAYMYRPYNNTESVYGIAVCSDEDFDGAIAFCKKHRIQLAVHAMGMRAIDRSIAKAVGQPCWTDQVPHFRIEHATDPSEAALAIAKEYGVAFTTQDDFPFSEIESYKKNLGQEWIRHTYPIPAIMNAGVKLALSTDAPATAWGDPSDPFINMKFAVTRTAYDGTDCNRDLAIDIRTAVELYTREGAEVTGFHDLGQLAVGYKANFVVLDKDIFEIPAEDIDTVSVEQTFIKGECVFSNSR